MPQTRHSRSIWDPPTERSETEKLVMSIGHWLAGLKSYTGHVEGGWNTATPSDAVREVRLIQSVLMRISRYVLELSAPQVTDNPGRSDSSEDHLKGENTYFNELAELLRELVLMGRAHVISAESDPAAVAVWKRSVYSRIADFRSTESFIGESESLAKGDLPDAIRQRLAAGDFPERWAADLEDILPRIAVAMSYLQIVSSMLERDEPLKTSVMLFYRIDEILKEMMDLINARLQHFPDDSDALFGSLDAAAYTASIELKKVHSNELKGLVEIRPTPLVFAKIETAYSLLNDSLQMTLVNFAQLFDRDIEPSEVFPNLLTKEQQSIQLRENLWHLLQTVQQAEQDPANCDPSELKRELNRFRDRNLYYLFYKDMETVERFIEEVVFTENSKDLVPLLHRFGAYIETLLGQVNMRVVLAKHPFEPLQKPLHEFPD